MLRWIAVFGLALLALVPALAADVKKFKLGVFDEEGATFCLDADAAVEAMRFRRAGQDDKAREWLIAMSGEGRCGNMRVVLRYTQQIYRGEHANGDLFCVYVAEISTSGGLIRGYVMLKNYEHEGAA